jgi:probable rRNA maturation factor
VTIEFEYSSESYKVFNEKKIQEWIFLVLGKEEKDCGTIYYHFVGEEEILEINRLHLNHDYYTDIITFDECFVNIINGDIFISPDTIKSNSNKLALDYITEVYRVIIHGIMHLCGHLDGNETQKKEMRHLEDKYLSYLEKL